MGDRMVLRLFDIPGQGARAFPGLDPEAKFAQNRQQQAEHIEERNADKGRAGLGSRLMSSVAHAQYGPYGMAYGFANPDTPAGAGAYGQSARVDSAQRAAYRGDEQGRFAKTITDVMRNVPMHAPMLKDGGQLDFSGVGRNILDAALSLVAPGGTSKLFQGAGVANQTFNPNEKARKGVGYGLQAGQLAAGALDSPGTAAGAAQPAAGSIEAALKSMPPPAQWGYDAQMDLLKQFLSDKFARRVGGPQMPGVRGPVNPFMFGR